MKLCLIVIAAVIAGLPHHTLADHELQGQNIVRGKSLYTAQCASCHGVNLEGQPNWRVRNADGILPAPPHDETGHTWHHDNALLFLYTKLGGEGVLKLRDIEGFKSGMPAFSEILSDDEIRDILAYIQSTWPGHIQEIQASRNPLH